MICGVCAAMLALRRRAVYEKRVSAYHKDTLLIYLFYFLLNVVKNIIVKELPQRYVQPVTYLLKRNYTRILAFLIEHTVYG